MRMYSVEWGASGHPLMLKSNRGTLTFEQARNEVTLRYSQIAAMWANLTEEAYDNGDWICHRSVTGAPNVRAIIKTDAWARARGHMGRLAVGMTDY